MSSRGRSGAPSALRSSSLSECCPWFSSACVRRCRRSGSSPRTSRRWKLETAYWNYVKAVDLDGYRNLWHRDFVGWPSSSSQPARKDHITDWITASTDKGIRLQWYSIQPAASQATENIVIVHYWVTSFWADKAGHGEPPETNRITHTWIKTGDGWQILGGMSNPPIHGK